MKHILSYKGKASAHHADVLESFKNPTQKGEGATRFNESFIIQVRMDAQHPQNPFWKEQESKRDEDSVRAMLLL